MSTPLNDSDLMRLAEQTNTIRNMFGPIRLWPNDGLPMKPASNEFAYVVAKAHGQQLYGYYAVIKTSEIYLFMLMERREVYGHLHLTPEFAFIPLTETMGVGDWDDVTPEKIMTFV